MSDIKCLVCKGKHFRSGKYNIEAGIDIYSTAYNDVRGYDGHGLKVNTDIIHETDIQAELDFQLDPEDKDSFGYGESKEIYKYACENCGYIMSFTKEVNVISKEKEKKQKQKESSYDWTNFK